MASRALRVILRAQNPTAMIYIDIQRICKLRAIEHPYTFLTQHGFHHNLAHKLANGRVKEIHLEILERLCRAFHCLPNDLLNYKPAAKSVTGPVDILLPLRKAPVDHLNLNALFRDLPPEDVLKLSTELTDRFRKPPTDATT